MQVAKQSSSSVLGASLHIGGRLYAEVDYRSDGELLATGGLKVTSPLKQAFLCCFRHLLASFSGVEVVSSSLGLHFAQAIFVIDEVRPFLLEM